MDWSNNNYNCMDQSLKKKVVKYSNPVITVQKVSPALKGDKIQQTLALNDGSNKWQSKVTYVFRVFLRHLSFLSKLDLCVIRNKLGRKTLTKSLNMTLSLRLESLACVLLIAASIEINQISTNCFVISSIGHYCKSAIHQKKNIIFKNK